MIQLNLQDDENLQIKIGGKKTVVHCGISSLMSACQLTKMMLEILEIGQLLWQSSFQ